MAKLSIKPGSTDVSVGIFIADSASTTGGGKTGLAYNTGSLTCYYCRPGAAAAQLSLATQTVNGAHSDGGFVEIDATNMPGCYRLDLSDAIVATGARSSILILKGASGMAPCPLEIDLSSQVDATAISGDATAADNCESYFDGTGYADTDNVVTLAASQGNYAPAKAGDAMTLSAACDATSSAASGAAKVDRHTASAARRSRRAARHETGSGPADGRRRRGPAGPADRP